jgi:hypothetical protein
MPAVRFDGAADIIVVGVGGVAIGAHTIIQVSRRFNTGVWHGTYAADTTTAGTVRTAFEWTNSNFLLHGSQATVSNGSVTTGDTSTTDWVGSAATHGSASGISSMYKRNLTANTALATDAGVTGTWIPVNAPTRNTFGLFDGTDDFNGWLAVVAYFNGVLSAAQVTECFANRRTSDIWNNSFGQPAALWEFNVAAASIVDLSGNGASYVSNVGTSLDAAEVPPWTYDGKGVGITSQDTSTAPGIAGEFDPHLNYWMWA